MKEDIVIGSGDYQVNFIYFDYGQRQNSILLRFSAREDAEELLKRWTLARKEVHRDRKLSWLASAQYKKYSLRWLACFRVIVHKNFLDTQDLTTWYYRPANFQLSHVRRIDYINGHFKVS